MKNYFFNENEIYYVDIHNYNCVEAEEYLNKLVSNMLPQIKEIIVIHGFNRGKALRDMVRNKFQNSRVERKILFLNEGRTSLILKN